MDSFTEQTLILLSVLFPESFIETMLMPLNPYLVKHLLKIDANSDNKQIGQYVGLLGSAFYSPLFIMNAVWGSISDKKGRKPVLLAGLFVCGLSIAVYSVSKSFWLCFSMRFLAGLFGANSTVTKGMLGELAKSNENRAWAYAMYGAVFGVAGMLGPFVGGLLVKLNEGSSPTYPLLLPGLLSAFMAFCGFYLTKYHLEETSIPTMSQSIPVSPLSDRQAEMESCLTDNFGKSSSESVPYSSNDDFVAASEATELKSEDLEVNPLIQKNLNQSITSPTTLANITVNPINTDGGVMPLKEEPKSAYIFGIPLYIPEACLDPIILYSIISCANMTYIVSLPLFFDAEEGKGLGLSPSASASIIAVISGTKLFFQVLFFKPVLQWLGTVGSFQLGLTLICIGNLLLCFISSSDQIVALLFLLMLLGMGEVFGYLAIIMITTNTVNGAIESGYQSPTDESSSKKNQLGLVHGVASTCAAIVRAITPTLTGFMWEWSVGGQTKHAWVVFVWTALISFLGIVYSFRVF